MFRALARGCYLYRSVAVRNHPEHASSTKSPQRTDDKWLTCLKYKIGRGRVLPQGRGVMILRTWSSGVLVIVGVLHRVKL